jgi:ACS family tartrate transporter-like MFS transporter
MGLINSVGNLGGFFGSVAIGYLNKDRGGFLYGFGFVALSLLVASVVCLALKAAHNPDEVNRQAVRG